MQRVSSGWRLLLACLLLATFAMWCRSGSHEEAINYSTAGGNWFILRSESHQLIGEWISDQPSSHSTWWSYSFVPASIFRFADWRIHYFDRDLHQGLGFVFARGDRMVPVATTDPTVIADGMLFGRAVAVPYYALAALWGTLLLISICSSVRHRRRRLAGKCQKCGYDLRASAGRCPECGRPMPAAAPQNVAINSRPDV